jgi:hypothetical protein
MLALSREGDVLKGKLYMLALRQAPTPRSWSM